MPASTFPKNANDGSLQFKDGTGTPVTLTVPYDLGNFQVTGLNRKLRNMVPVEARGTFINARHTTRAYPQISFGAIFTHFTSATATSILDFLWKQNNYSSNVSTLGSAADVYTVDVVLTVEGSNFGDSSDHTVTFEDVYFVSDFAEGESYDQLNLTGTVLGKITGDLTSIIPA